MDTARREVCKVVGRIVYVVDETGPMIKFGFPYGMLPAHAGSSEK